jgi:hypothetical protein
MSTEPDRCHCCGAERTYWRALLAMFLPDERRVYICLNRLECEARVEKQAVGQAPAESLP